MENYINSNMDEKLEHWRKYFFFNTLQKGEDGIFTHASIKMHTFYSSLRTVIEKHFYYPKIYYYNKYHMLK